MPEFTADAYDKLKVTLNLMTTEDEKQFKIGFNFTKRTIILLMDLVINVEIMDALKQLDAVKIIKYCHNVKEAAINQEAKMMVVGS